MKRGVFSIAAMVFVLILSSCTQDPALSPQDSLAITGVVPPVGEMFEGNLTVVFNKPIPRDSATTTPLVFTPPLEGDFFVGPNYINFTKTQPSFARIIDCRVHDSVRPAHDGASTKSLSFALVTFEFKPSAFWPLERSTTSTLFGLQFTAPVKLDGVKPHAALTTNNGKPVKFDVLPGKDASIVRLLTPPTTGTLTLNVSAGVPEEKDRFRTRREAEFTISPEPKKPVEPLRLYSVGWEETDRDHQRIQLYFNRKVAPEIIQSHLAITDVSTTVTRRLAFKVVKADYSIVVEISAPDPNDVKIHLELPAGIPAIDKTLLAEPLKTDLAFRMQLAIEGSSWDNEEAGLTLNLGFSHGVKLDDLKKHLSIQPPVSNMALDQQYDSRVRIRGDFATKTPYQITVSPGLAFGRWGVSKRSVYAVANSPDSLPNYLAFSDTEKYYFPRRFGNAIPVKTRGMKSVDATLSRMFPNNIAVGLRQITNNDPDRMDRWSEVVGSATIPVAGKMNQLITTPIPLDALTTAPIKGVYVLHVASTDKAVTEYGYEYTPTVDRIVLMTDMGVLAHWQDGEATVFVHNLFTLAPIAGATVQVYSDKNQLLGEMKTDAQGIARLTNFGPTKGAPTVAVVTHGKDYTFVAFEQNDGVPSFIDESGGAALRYNAHAYDGFIYADRNLYRPGEIVHLRCLARKNYGDALTSAPMVLKIVGPNERVALQKTLVLSKNGTAGLDFQTLDSFATGQYAVTLSVPGSDDPIGVYMFQLEEFVPLRMKAELTPPAAPWVETGEDFTLHVKGRHLTGQPAQDRTADALIRFGSGFEFKNWPAYRFGNDDFKPIEALDLGQQTTNADGVATFMFKAPQAAQATQPLRARIVGHVLELGGRAVRASADAVYFPSPICLGVKVGDDGSINIAAVAPDGSPAELDKANVTVERETYDYYVRRMYSHSEPDWTPRYEQVQSADVTLSHGLGRLPFDAKIYGFYRVKVTSAGTRQYSTTSFYSWGGRPQVNNDPRPSLIKLKLDKNTVEAGQSARLRIESAFDGKGVIVIQGEHIYKLVPVDIKNGAANVDLPIAPAYAPNVWLEVTVIHAVEKGRSQVYPFSSFAAVPLMVRDPARRIDVEIGNLPKEILPGAQLPLILKTASAGKPVSAEVTLAAVDEGIHLLTGYRTPDPIAWFGRQRYPDFNRAEYYDKIASDFNAPAAGGDGLGPERLGRPARTWIRTVALWTGKLTTADDGTVSVTLPIPSTFNGQLRLVAVAANPVASGSRGDTMFVRRPWMLQTSMPRFMLPGDRAAAFATVYNSTDSTGSVRLTFVTSGTLTATESQPIEQTVGPHAETTIIQEILAGKSVGQGELVWKAEVFDSNGFLTELLTEQAYLPVTEPASWQSRRTLMVLDPGKSATFDTAGFMQDDWTRLSVTVGADPLMRLNKALHYLVGYPYGCVEQTTSKLLSLYLLRKNSALIADLDPKMGPLDIYIRYGIDRLFSMQTGSGGLAYWPGYQDAYPYGSVYALHFLTLVRNGREFAVDPNSYEILRRYVRQLITEKTGDNHSDLYLRAYATYVLALSGDPEAPALTEWFRLLEMPRSARWLLASAIAVATHDTDRVKLYLHSANTVQYTDREQDGTINSPIRNEAVELLSLTHMNGDRKEMHKRAEDLTHWLQTERWGTTQENAFVIGALCQYLDKVTSGAEQARGRVQFGDTQTSITGRGVFRKKAAGPNLRCKVINDGPFALYVTSVVQGIPTDTQTSAVTQGLSISRRILDSKARVVKPSELVHGGSYIVEIEIGCERDVENVVVTDLLPAGLEIDNPRLNQDESTGIILPHDSVQPMHLEIRDERLVLVFQRLDATTDDNKHHFYYLVNAVTPGKFQHPAIAAEAMYDPAVRAASTAEEIVVRK